MMKLDTLAKMKEELERKEKEIDRLYEFHGIRVLADEAGILRQELKQALEEIGDKITNWEPDTFNPKALAHWEGRVGIIRTCRSVRSVRAAEFIDAHPLVAASIATIPVEAAERHVGAKDLERFVDRKEQVRYELITRATVKPIRAARKDKGKKRTLLESQRRIKVEALGK